MNCETNLPLSHKNVHLKPCPFCGFTPNIAEDHDVLYPIDRTLEIWNLVCPSTSGGCDASILGDSSEDVIKKWNTRK